jgi:hypothetical protein
MVFSPRSHPVPFDNAIESFRKYVTFYREDDARWADVPFEDSDEGSDICLADLISEWLIDEDDAAIHCFGDFEVFLKVVAYLIDHFYQVGAGKGVVIIRDDPDEGDDALKRYRVTSVFGYQPGGGPYSHRIFDRDNFARATCSSRTDFFGRKRQ